jgi:glycine oxidase
MTKTDYIIIGGGIIGMTTARELAIQGANVAIFDRGELGMESSWAAGGIISPMRPWAESSESVLLSEYSKKLYPKYVEELSKDTDIDSEYIKSGLVIIDEEHAAKTKKWAVNREIELIENFEQDSSHIQLPEYSVLLPEIAQVRPPKLLKALRKSLEKLSVSIFENTQVTNLEIKNDQIQSVEFESGKAVADAIIITAGAWSNIILKNINIDVDTKPVRGQMLCVKSDEEITKQMVLDGPHYFIPRKDGHLIIGSTMEDVGFVNETTKQGRQELLDWAFSMSPSLRKAKPVSHWAGLRPSTDSGKPFIGRVPDYKNIYLNTGHFRKGILQAPASAQLLVDSILGKLSFMDIEKFNVDCRKRALEIA